MININDLNESRFTLNGVQYFKNYLTRLSGTGVSIYNAYNPCDVLVPHTLYDKYHVNGDTFENAEELQSALAGICYTRTTLLEGSPQDQNNIGKIISFGELLPQNNKYITREEVAVKINALSEPIIITGKETPVNITFTRQGKMYGFEFMGGKGIWGGNASEVFPHHFILKTLYDLTPEDLTRETSGATIISLGEIVDDNYLFAANSTQRDFSLSGQKGEDGLIKSYYFTYTTNNILKFIQFVGEAGVYNSNLKESDFVSSTNSKASPIIDYESVLQYGKAAISPALHIDATDGSITEYNSNGFKKIVGDYSQNFKIEQPTGNFEVTLPAATQDDSIVYRSALQSDLSNIDLQYVVDKGNVVSNSIILYDTENDVTSIYKGNGLVNDALYYELFNSIFLTSFRIYYPQILGISASIKMDNISKSILLQLPDASGTIALEENTIPLSGTKNHQPLSGNINIDATSPIGLVASSAGQIMFDNNEGITINGNDGGVTLYGSTNGVSIYGEGGPLNFFGNVGGIIISGGSYGVTFSGDSYMIEGNPFSYAEDFSMYYTNRSLVDKEYVDNSRTTGNGFGYWNGTDISWVTGTYQQVILANGTVADLDTIIRAQNVGTNIGSDMPITTTTSFQAALWSLQAQLSTTNAIISDLSNQTTRNLLNTIEDSAALTGTTQETILSSHLIAPGDISEGILKVAASFQKIGISGNAYYRLYINSSNNLSGAERIASLNSTSSARLYTHFSREFLIKNGIIYGFPPLISSFDGYVDTVGEPLSKSVNIANDLYIIMTSVLENGQDSVIQKSFKITSEKIVG